MDAVRLEKLEHGPTLLFEKEHEMEWLEKLGRLIAQRIGAERSDDRNSPYAVLTIFSIGLPAILGLTFLLLSVILFDSGLIHYISTLAGITIGILVVLASLEKYFIIRNSSTGMFVTQDMLKSFLGDADFHVSYGPGVHICLPWERRLKENNISLEEAAQDFTFEVQCADGVLYGEGSYRLRPDGNNPVTFLLGVAAVASEISDLVAVEAVKYTSSKTVMEAREDLAGLNDRLYERLVEGTSEIEERFAVEMTDVTIKKLLPSAELQRTISAISEGDAVAIGTARTLGYKSVRALRTAITKGKVTKAEEAEARRQFLAISGNMDPSLTVNRTEFVLNLDGLDPEQVDAIRELAKTPAAQAAAAAYAAKNKRGSGAGKSRSKNKASNQ